jgi:hypothetical protein
MEMGWMDGILNVNTNLDPEGEVEEENLLKNYGTMTLEQGIESEKGIHCGAAAEGTRHLHVIPAMSYGLPI